MMKNYFKFKTLSLFLATGFLSAETTLETTDIPESKGPTADQLEVAREILAEAIEALQDENIELYEEKLRRARLFQRYRQVNVQYDAAILYDTSRGFINYFEDLEDVPFYQGHFLSETCYRGERNVAIALLNAAIRGDYLNFDEEWYENARASNDSDDVLVSYVNGPDEYTANRLIAPCED